MSRFFLDIKIDEAHNKAYLYVACIIMLRDGIRVLEAVTEEDIAAKTGAGRGRQKTGQPVRVAVAGATGYAGRELIALLAGHPSVRLASLMSSGRSGNDPIAAEVSHPSLRGVASVLIEPLNLERLTPDEVDVAFLATPHEASHDLVPALLERGLRVIDLSAAFRLRDPEAYPGWYGFEHRASQSSAHCKSAPSRRRSMPTGT